MGGGAEGRFWGIYDVSFYINLMKKTLFFRRVEGFRFVLNKPKPREYMGLRLLYHAFLRTLFSEESKPFQIRTNFSRIENYNSLTTMFKTSSLNKNNESSASLECSALNHQVFFLYLMYVFDD